MDQIWTPTMTLKRMKMTLELSHGSNLDTHSDPKAYENDLEIGSVIFMTKRYYLKTHAHHYKIGAFLCFFIPDDD